MWNQAAEKKTAWRPTTVYTWLGEVRILPIKPELAIAQPVEKTNWDGFGKFILFQDKLSIQLR